MKYFLSGIGLCLVTTFCFAFQLTSPAFKNGSTIPVLYTCDGPNVSPPLQWSGPPANTQSYVLMLSDPDAPGGTWYHWALFNIPKDVVAFNENIDNFPKGMKIAKNSLGNSQYNGPCPPSGRHRYIFTLYALDQMLTLREQSNYRSVLYAMRAHVLGSAKLLGYYPKKSS